MTATGPSAQVLHLNIGASGSLKIGTCQHCIIREPGRPERAWNPNGDSELDQPLITLVDRASLTQAEQQVLLSTAYPLLGR